MWDDIFRIVILIFSFGLLYWYFLESFKLDGWIRFGYGIVLLCVLLLRSFDIHMVWPLTQKGDGFLGARPTVAAWTIASFPSKSHSSLAAIPRSASWATEAMRCRLGRGRAGPQCRSHAMPPFSATPHATKGATQNFSRATEISNWATVCIALFRYRERTLNSNNSSHVYQDRLVKACMCAGSSSKLCVSWWLTGWVLTEVHRRSPGRQAPQPPKDLTDLPH